MEATPGRCRNCAAETTWPDPWAARALNRLCEPCQANLRHVVTEQLNPSGG